MDRIRADDKYFACSRADLERVLGSDGECEVYCDHEVDDDGEKVTAKLRLNINAKNPSPNRWTISLKLHGIRVDGLDWQPYYDASDGQRHKGWHRHIFDRKSRSAKKLKQPLPRFGDGIFDVGTFLVRGLSELKVTVSKVDIGEPRLPID